MDLEAVEVDAFLADSVVVAENKIYVQGAGWDTVFTGQFPFKHPRIGVGILVRVPYTETNKMHDFSLRIVDQDGNKVPLGDAPPGTNLPQGKIHELVGQFNVGRPPLLGAGDSQLFPIAVNIDGLEFLGPNNYSVAIIVDTKELRRLPLRVRTTMQMPGYAPPPLRPMP